MATPQETKAVLNALTYSDYEWRTITGLAQDTDLKPETVHEVIKENPDKVRRSLKPSRDGQDLYRKRPHNIEAIATELAETEPGDIQKTGSLVIELLNRYNEEVLSQAKKSFTWAVIVAVSGFAFFISSLVILFTMQLQQIATIGIIGGAIVEVVAGLQFYLYGKTTTQLAYFQQSLDRTQRFLIANSICEALEGENKQKSRAELVKYIALSAQPTPIAASDESKTQ